MFNAKDKYITENFKFIASECVRILYKNDIEVDKDTVVTWIPRRKKTIRRIGHDQSKLIARYVAHELELPLVRVFANKGNAPQKKQGFSDRIKNAGDSYLITRCGRKKISRKFVIIVDDLVTTGATMQVAISLALANGAEDVVPLTFAKTDRGHKKYTGRR